MKTVRTLFTTISIVFLVITVKAQWTTSGADIYNANTGNVGIGTTTPLYKLHVVNTEPSLEATITVQNSGGTVGSSFRMVDDIAQSYWKFKTTSTGNFKIRDEKSLLDVFTIEKNAAANALYIKAGGNIGIGTTAPVGKFVVYGGGNNPDNYNTYSADQNREGLIINSYNLGQPNTWLRVQDIVGGQGNTASKIRFLTADWWTYSPVARMVIEPNGNIGIGTSAPATALHIFKDAGTTPNWAQLVIEPSNSTYSAATFVAKGSSIVNRWYFGAGNGTTNNFRIVSMDNAGSVLSEPFNITVNGNVGIGNITPSAKLSVKEITALGGTLGNSKIISRMEGRVTNGFQNNLYVYRDAAGGDWYTARWHDAIGVDASFQTPGVDTKTWWERDPANNIQSWGNDASTYMTINAGKVGIGSATPIAKLNIKETTALGGTLGSYQIISRMEGENIGNNCLSNNLYIYRDLSGTDLYTNRWHDALGISASSPTPRTNTKTWWERDPTDNIQSWGNDASTYMTINAGKVGIGTTTPTTPLDVVGAGKFTGTVTAAQATNANELITKGQAEKMSFFNTNIIGPDTTIVSNYPEMRIKNKNNKSLFMLEGSTSSLRMFIGNEKMSNNVSRGYITNKAGNGFVFNQDGDARVGVLKFNSPQYYFPEYAGLDGQVLTTDAAGNCYWSTVSGGTGSSTVSTSGFIEGDGSIGNPVRLLENVNWVPGSYLRWNGDDWVPSSATIPGDNWGTQRVLTDATLTGNGYENQLGIAQQGATSGQVLKWNGSAWAPGNVTGSGDNWGTQTTVTDATLTGNGTSATPLKLAQNSATTGQVLKWNGTSWAPATVTGTGDNWGTQTTVTDATLTGNGTSATPLKLAQNSATTGQVLKWNGTSWSPGVDATGNAGAVSTSGFITGDGSSTNTIRLNNGTATGQVLKWNHTTTTWELGTDNSGGTGTVITDATLTGEGSALNVLGVANNGITSTKILNGTIISEDLTDNAITTAKINAGAVTGVKIAQQGATTGQVLKWVGATWAPADDNDIDNDITNEIQTLSLSGSTVYLSKGGGSFTLPWESYSSGTVLQTMANSVIIGSTVGDLNGTISDRLFVRGRILAHEVVVERKNWSDYVFDKEYNLPKLSEVEDFINKNKHLPDLPSEETVKKEGVSLGEMNALLLKKIEELTLYSIQMEKRMNEMEKTIEKLSK